MKNLISLLIFTVSYHIIYLLSQYIDIFNQKNSCRRILISLMILIEYDVLLCSHHTIIVFIGNFQNYWSLLRIEKDYKIPLKKIVHIFSLIGAGRLNK